MSGAGFIIALGIFIILLSILGINEKKKLKSKFFCCFYLGFLGAFKNRLNLLKIFIGSLAVILLLEFIATIVGFTLGSKADNRLRNQLLNSMAAYKSGDKNVIREWNRLQQKWSCCGVDSPDDWNTTASMTTPPSCCLNENCESPTGNTTATYFQDGCYQYAHRLFSRYSKSLGGVSLFFFFVELIGLILAVLLLRDVKNNYGTV